MKDRVAYMDPQPTAKRTGVPCCHPVSYHVVHVCLFLFSRLFYCVSHTSPALSLSQLPSRVACEVVDISLPPRPPTTVHASAVIAARVHHWVRRSTHVKVCTRLVLVSIGACCRQFV